MSSIGVSRLLVYIERALLLRVLVRGLLLLSSVLMFLVLVLACCPADLSLSGVLWCSHLLSSSHSGLLCW